MVLFFFAEPEQGHILIAPVAFGAFHVFKSIVYSLCSHCKQYFKNSNYFRKQSFRICHFWYQLSSTVVLTIYLPNFVCCEALLRIASIWPGLYVPSFISQLSQSDVTTVPEASVLLPLKSAQFYTNISSSVCRCVFIMIWKLQIQKLFSAIFHGYVLVH